MNKFKYFFGALFTVILFFISCDEQDNEILSEESIENPTNCNYTIIGQMHNDGLDSFYSYFIADSAWSESSMLEKLDSLVLSRREENNLGLSSPHWPLREEKAIEINSIMSDNLSSFLSNDATLVEPILLGEGLSTENFNILLEIRDLLYLEYNDFNELLSAIEMKESALENEGKMSYFIEEPINILKASICYWAQSFERWDSVPTSSVTLRWCGHDEEWFWNTVNNMAEDDFWSGALGAVIADGGGAVSGALYGSAASGISHLFDGC
ncbi:MAG: hypothetical protein GVX78_04635 [Bacteroidetes bacterium]|jgi:hypothetical protein|nr:hypothetical protein [Bacteroidota bacterium]